MQAARTNWASERRLDYIDWRMLTAGTLRRADIMRTFGVSQVQASVDITEFTKRYPDALVYDKSAKQYVPADRRYRSVRRLDNRILAALASIAASGHDMAWS
jgi:hypothetical protein